MTKPTDAKATIQARPLSCLSMTGRRILRRWTTTGVSASFFAGILIGWLLRAYGPLRPAIWPDIAVAGEERTHVMSGSGRTKPSEPMPAATFGSHPTLRVPIAGVDVESFKGGFSEHRNARPHEAVDILAPRHTPVHAVSDGTIAKLFYSPGGGGNTIYQFDTDVRLCYYYAHLEGYATGLQEGQSVSQGNIIGYVGTSGNAPPNTPHLHFAVFEVNADHHWWEGRAVDPYLVFTGKLAR